MPSRRRSLLLSLRNAYEALAVSAPTVIDAARGRLTREVCDARLESFAEHVIRNLKMTVRVHGAENLATKDERTFVVMSNHESHYDVPVLYYVLGGKLRMVAKKELFSLPVFGQAIRQAGMIEVDRQNRTRAIASLRTAKTQLAHGTHIWIAPEGTRSPTGKLLPFKKGGFVLALDMEAPILPITIRGTREALHAHDLLTRPGVEVDVTIHPPVETAVYAKQEPRAARTALMADVRRAIESSF